MSTDWVNLIKSYGGIGPNGRVDQDLNVLKGTLFALIHSADSLEVKQAAFAATNEVMHFLSFQAFRDARADFAVLKYWEKLEELIEAKGQC